jgi:hypothetical protein
MTYLACAKFMENFCGLHCTSPHFVSLAGCSVIGRHADDVCKVNDISEIDYKTSSVIGCAIDDFHIDYKPSLVYLPFDTGTCSFNFDIMYTHFCNISCLNFFTLFLITLMNF